MLFIVSQPCGCGVSTQLEHEAVESHSETRQPNGGSVRAVFVCLEHTQKLGARSSTCATLFASCVRERPEHFITKNQHVACFGKFSPCRIQGCGVTSEVWGLCVFSQISIGSVFRFELCRLPALMSARITERLTVSAAQIGCGGQPCPRPRRRQSWVHRCRWRRST